MKCLPILVVSLWLPGRALPAQELSAATKSLTDFGVDLDVATFFSKVKPEFLRYSMGISIYGNTLASTQPGKKAVDAEVALYEKRKKAKTLAKANRSDALLSFNLIIHRPEVGRGYFEEFAASVRPTEDPSGFLRNVVRFGVIVGGAWGERLAVRGLSDPDVDRRRMWAQVLGRDATFLESSKPIQARIAKESDAQVCAWSIYALATIKDQTAAPTLRERFASEKRREVRSAIVFAVAELMGHDAIPWLDQLEVTDEEVKTRIANSRQYLLAETTEQDKFGFEVGNDTEFVQRFYDLRTPSMMWLRQQGHLEDAALAAAEAFGAEDKAKLFAVLEQSRGFGLEAIKGALFKSLAPTDIPRLLRLRSVSAYCPNRLVEGRLRTLGIMIRSQRVAVNKKR